MPCPGNSSLFVTVKGEQGSSLCHRQVTEGVSSEVPFESYKYTEAETNYERRLPYPPSVSCPRRSVDCLCWENNVTEKKR